MTRPDLLARVRQKPFHPFRLVSSEGATYEIRHPDFLMVGRDSIVIGQANDPAQDFYDSTVLIDLFHVVRLEPLEAGAAAGGNGAGSPK
jgi:hypothetical protein